MVAVRNKSGWTLAAAALICAVAAENSARGAVQMEEDLSGCKLPNDVKVLPAPGTPDAKSGSLFKGSNGTLGTFPMAADGKALSPDEAVAKIRETRSGDLQYSPDHDGSLWAFSGNISELGTMYLADAASKPMDPPLEIPRTSRNSAGSYPGIHEGRVYLVLTTEGRYMLVRVLEKTGTALVIQYVYQPGAGLTFDIPHNQPVTYRTLAQSAAANVANGNASAGAPAVPGAVDVAPRPLAEAEPPLAPRPGPAELPRIASTLPPPPPPAPLGPGDVIEPGRIVLRSGGPNAPSAAALPAMNAPASSASSAGASMEPSLDAMLRTREQMIQKRLAIVTAPTHSDADVDKKAQAIYELTYLQANEAADVFVAQIAFLETHSTVKEFSPDALHPCFGALKRLGKAATAASIKGLKQLDLSAPGEGIDSAAYKADLLGRVVRAVEGNDVAEFIFHRELDHETDPKRRAVFELLLSKAP